MGRITIFTRASCIHCRRAKATLASRGFEYTEISLSDHPERREAMTALTNKVTVPQIFLNDAHLGGNDDLEARIKNDPNLFDEEVRAALAREGPIHRSLAMCDESTASNARVETANETEDAFLFPRTKTPPSLLEMDHVEATCHLADYLNRRNRIRNTPIGLTVHARCFDGVALRDAARDALEAVERSKGAAVTDEAVRRECARLLTSGTVERVAAGRSRRLETTKTNDVSNDDDDDDDDDERCTLKNVPFCDDGIYRLPRDREPGIVNSFRESWPDGAPSDANADVRRILAILSRLELKHADAQTNLIDRVGLGNDPEFNRVLDRFSSFATFDLSTLRTTGPSGKTEKSEKSEKTEKTEKTTIASSAAAADDSNLVAFLINVYAVIVKLAATTIGVPRDALGRRTYFKRAGIRFADGVYSLDDIEHGLLRGNAGRRFFGIFQTDRLAPADRRSAHVARWGPRFDPACGARAVDGSTRAFDPRVHFALNCGAKSCPPVAAYRGERLDAELAVAAAGFCEHDDNVQIISGNGNDAPRVRLSRLFLWYRADFGKDDREVLSRIAAWCPEGGAKREGLRRAAAAAAENQTNLRARIVYAAYDWSTDATPESLTYHSRNARASWGRVTGA
jgi:glutaredoxin